MFKRFTEFQFESEIMNSGISNNFDGLLPTMKQNKTPMGPPINFGQWEEGIQERLL